MGKQQRKYEKEYKVEAVKLAKEIGVRKAARELGVPENTLYGWMKAARGGRLDMGAGSHTPNSAMLSGRGIGSDAQADENVGA